MLLIALNLFNAALFMYFSILRLINKTLNLQIYVWSKVRVIRQ
jgi:hypothetical protein